MVRGMECVVELDYPAAGIAVVTMMDRRHQNTFSASLIKGLIEAFGQINANEAIKVVIINGYDNYFCCGGTKEELIAIHEGRKSFTDFDFYRLLLDCEVPVISAMQGHAIGAGLAFGCYADLMVLAEECLYSASFMKYGFTPGFGSTFIIPKKMGNILGAEMLFSANNYHGGELKERGISAKVVRKNQVISTAMELAGELAGKPRTSLKLLKHQLSQSIKEKLPAVIKQELAMHELSFCHAEVRERIETLFSG